MVSIYIDPKLQRFEREIKYTFAYIFETIGFEYRFIPDTDGLKPNDIFVFYSITELPVDDLKSIARHYVTIFIHCEPDFYEPKALTKEKVRRSLKEVKLLYASQIIALRPFHHLAENYIETDISGGKINFDLVGNVFFHLSKKELDLEPRFAADERIPDESSAFYHHREFPVVDSLLWLLDSMIREHVRHKKTPIIQKMRWPDDQNAAVILSHTVNDLQKWDLSSLVLSVADDFTLFFTFKWRQWLHTVWGKMQYMFTNYELYWNFDEFRKLERENSCRSTYYLATDKCADIDYSLDDPDLQEEIQQILGDGSDIGLLMPNDKLNRDDMMTRKQIMLHQLSRDKIGIRQLGYVNNPDILDLHHKIGPAYSQSSAYREAPGFYDGTTMPYYPYINGKASFMMLPTTYHDAFLRINKHTILDLDDAKAQIKKFYQQVQRTRGILGLDFSLAAYSDIHYCNKLYAYTLALIKSSPTWITTALELSTWWEKRNRVTIEESEYDASVLFPDDLENMCLQVLGDVKIHGVNGVQARIDGNTIRITNIKAGSCANIRFSKG